MRARLTVLGVVAALAVSACSGAPAPDDAVGLGPDGGGPLPGASSGPTAPGQPGATTAPGKRPAGGQPGATTGAAGSGSGGSTGVGGTGGTGIGGTGATGGGTGTARPGELQLFSGAANTQGISKTAITLCMHSALTYAAAFQTTEDDFNVFWDNLNDTGGIHGRKVNVTYLNDDYKPEPAVQAAEQCAERKPFMLLGGIGFDQIPAVRNWAEAHKMLYLHHSATVEGSAGKRYSFTLLPTIETLGKVFAEVAARRWPGQKIGVIRRDSDRWEPGYKAFVKRAKELELNLGPAYKTPQNQGNFNQELTEMRDAGVKVLWIWENALVATQIIPQAKAQRLDASYLLFPFNLTSQQLRQLSVQPPLIGVAAWPAYSFGDYGGPFASYAAEMKEFERQYAKYRPTTNLKGLGGDLLFLNWVDQKKTAHLLKLCGPGCTRNAFATLLSTYHGTPSSGCPIDFRADGHHGSVSVNELVTYRSPSGEYNWKPSRLCIRNG